MGLPLIPSVKAPVMRSAITSFAIFTSVCSALVLTAIAPAHATQTCQTAPLASFLNGSFEQPAFSGQSNYANFSNSQMVGWVSTDPLVSTYPNLAFEVWGDGFIGESAQDGTHFLELESNGAATVYQDFATTPGQVLTWSFYLTPRYNVNAFARLAVTMGNVADTNAVSTPVQQLTTGWQQHSGSYTVPAGQTTTRMTFVADQYFNTLDATVQKMVGPNHLDNVQVSSTVCTEVPASSPTPEVTVDTLASTGTNTTLVASGALGVLLLGAGLVSLYACTKSSTCRSRVSTRSTSQR